MPTFQDLGVAPDRAARLAARGITDPSPIQALALPALAEGRDALLAAQTGSGKTLAYLLPALARLEATARAASVASGKGGMAATPGILVLVPTQELGMQVRDVARGLLEGTDRTVAELIGGANPQRQAERLKAGADVIVGTAGRVTDFMAKGKLSLARLKVVILDEVDQLADTAHRSDVAAVLAAAAQGRQVVAASATLGDEARRWAKKFMQAPLELNAETSLELPKALTHQAVVADDRDQLPLLRRILANLNPAGAIAFFNRSADIDWIVQKLTHHGVRAAGLHSGVQKLERAKAMQDFRAGKLQLLVATELAARGLDLGAVTLVFNLDLPRGPEEYVHRVGRTARMGKAGTAITFADPKEAWVLEKLEKRLGITFERPIYTHGELREATVAEVKREARKAKDKAQKDEIKAKHKEAVEIAELEGLPAPRLKKPKKDKAPQATARQKAKGKARKAERKAMGAWKPSADKQAASKKARPPREASPAAPQPPSEGGAPDVSAS